MTSPSPGHPEAVSRLLERAREVAGDRDLAVWTAENDAGARASLLDVGATIDYVDIQMQRDTMLAAHRPPPTSTRLVTVEGPNDHRKLRALHELTCRAWDVDPWWEGFLDRFVRVAGFDPAYFVLLAPTTHDDDLVAAAIGWLKDTAGGELGVVSHVDVDPATRGVRADNASGAADLYRRRGWVEVSRAARWTLPS